MEKKPAVTNNEPAFQRFQRLIRGLASVPKNEVEAEEAKWRANHALKKKPAKA